MYCDDICSGHVESPKRIKRIFTRFRESGLLSRCKLLPVSLFLLLTDTCPGDEFDAAVVYHELH